MPLLISDVPWLVPITPSSCPINPSVLFRPVLFIFLSEDATREVQPEPVSGDRIRYLRAGGAGAEGVIVISDILS